MQWNEAIRARLKTLNLDGAREREIIEELADHLDDRYRELIASGVSHRAALRDLLEELDRHGLLAKELRATPEPPAREAAESPPRRSGAA